MSKIILKNNFIFLDLLRGISAILVFIGHLRGMLFVNFKIASSNVFERVFYFITGFGHEAVIIFFVLSGFFIVRSIMNSIARGDWNFKEYFFNRTIRLGVVVVPALFFTLILDYIGGNLINNFDFYSKPLVMGNFIVGENSSFSILLGNLFYLQTIIVPTFGSNGPLWSLSNEFWYYILFPVMLFSILNYYSFRIRALLILIFFSLLYFLFDNVLMYFIIWLLGGASFFVVKNNYLNMIKRRSVISISSFLLLLIIIRTKLFNQINSDLILGLATFVLIPVLIEMHMKTKLFISFSKISSKISFSLYVFHFPLVVFLSSFYNGNTLVFSFGNFMIFVVLFSVILAYCYLCYQLFEKNTKKVNYFVKKIIFRKRTTVKILSM